MEATIWLIPRVFTHILYVINIYLPKQKSEEETEDIVNDLIKKNNMETIKDMGKLMGLVKNDYAGEVDMGLVGKIAKSKLGN